MKHAGGCSETSEKWFYFSKLQKTFSARFEFSSIPLHKMLNWFLGLRSTYKVSAITRKITKPKGVPLCNRCLRFWFIYFPFDVAAYFLFRSDQLNWNFTFFFFYSQIDQNAREDFNVTSDVEFNAIRSLVLGRVHSKWGGRSDPDDAFEAAEHSDTDSFQKILCRTRQWGTGKCCLED